MLVKPLSPDRLRAIPQVEGLNLSSLLSSEQVSSLERPDVRRLRDALSFQPVDRPPHIEPRVSSKAVLEYVLERSLIYNQAELSSGRQMIEPEDWIEFARRTGLDAVPCEINWQPGAVEGGDLPGIAGRLRSAYPQPGLTESLNRLERFLRAAQGSSVGVYLTFGSLPATDGELRPLFGYGIRIHDNCERRKYFDAGQFVRKWGDEGARLGWCLYEMGCKGPEAYYNCPTVRWNEHTSWPVMAGHPCFACAHDYNWDVLGPIYSRLPNVPGAGRTGTADKIGIGVAAAAGAAVIAHAVTRAVKSRVSKDHPEEKDKKE
jgi:hypothetical protein